MEARGEPIMGQYAVALVTVNRAQQRPEKVCAEVFKPRQFSWTTTVRASAKGWAIPGPLIPREPHAWWVAQRVAAATLAGRMPDFTRGSTHYHARYVRPRWAATMVASRRIGLHVFYLPVISQG